MTFLGSSANVSHETEPEVALDPCRASLRIRARRAPELSGATPGAGSTIRPFPLRRNRPVIRETLVDAVRAALGRAGFPEPAAGIVLTPSDRPEHGDWTTNVALQIAKPAGVPPREAAPAHRRRARGRPARRTSTGSRSPGRASSTSTSRPPGSTTCCGRWSRRGERLRPRRRLRRAADQPRVRVGQPHRAAARGRRSLGRGRATRSPTSSRPRAPRCTASTTSTTRATSSTRSARRCSPGTGARNRRRTATRAQYLVEHGRPDAGRRWATRSPRSRPASGATATSSASSRTTSSASACTSTPGSRSARCTSGARSRGCSSTLADAGRDLRAGRRDCGCGPPTSATSATACS